MRDIVSKYLQVISSEGFAHSTSRIKHSLERRIRQKTIRYCGQTDANNNKVVYISPKKIIHSGTYLRRDHVENIGAVYSGKWDKPFHDYTKLNWYQSFKMRIVEGEPWEETPIYHHFRQKEITSDEIQQTLDYYDDLIQSIKNSGYKSQSELESDHHSSIDNEIGVVITRNGMLIRNGQGRRRFYISKIIGLEAIPVHIRVRHNEWQKKRDYIRDLSDYSSLDDPNILHHPDIEDII